ncbi:alpha-amylase family glycosyl hydrolase [Helicovermis profundi]|uniref:Alpha-amylase n=1 Tax=Helicovermis profundi TaxID=3065157 RepID=A0AAU9EIZ1_9FIRM|nr:hypothetical protein HLPR_02000 [Clostridia bacterium S502]
MKKLLNLVIMTTVCTILFTGCTLEKKPVSKTNIKYPVINNESKFSLNDKIYFLMVDRFNDASVENNIETNKNVKTTFHGGDILGVKEKLDYIKSMGFTAIWITPVVDNDLGGYHGYWAKDFYNVDENFGTIEDLKELTQEAHKKGIKIILDYVVNHTGPKSDLLTDGKHENWFHYKKIINDYTNKEEVEDGWLAGLPDLNTENPDVRKYLIDNAIWWIKETNVDGFRLDTVRHVPESFWNEFSYKIKEQYPDFYMIGEVWDSNVDTLEKYHELGLDGLLDYSLYYGIKDTFKDGGFVTKLLKAIENDKKFKDPSLNGIFIDNHDNARYFSLVRYNVNYLKEALTFMYSYPEIPIVYYGTEIPMKGGNDPDNRKDMQWNKVKDSKIIPYIKMLNSFRDKYVSNFKVVANDNKFIAYEVSKGNSKALVISNVYNGEKNISFEYKAKSLINYETKEDLSKYLVNGKITMTLKESENIILIVK